MFGVSVVDFKPLFLICGWARCLTEKHISQDSQNFSSGFLYFLYIHLLEDDE